jgi:hypothetical protein
MTRRKRRVDSIPAEFAAHEADIQSNKVSYDRAKRRHLARLESGMDLGTEERPLALRDELHARVE